MIETLESIVDTIYLILNQQKYSTMLSFIWMIQNFIQQQKKSNYFNQSETSKQTFHYLFQSLKQQEDDLIMKVNE